MPVTLLPINKFTRIEIDRSANPILDAQAQIQVDDAWRDLCARNPRYFNGPMLVFDSMNTETGVVSAREMPYQLHAVRNSINLGLSLLAMTGIVMADERVLLGQRSAQSHDYRGLWELGPSGGVDVPESGGRIDEQALLREVLREVREEAGFEPRVLEHRLIAMVHDHGAGSSDLALLLCIERPADIEPNWEYDDTRWMTLEELVAWCDDRPHELIPTTIALARFLRGS